MECGLSPKGLGDKKDGFIRSLRKGNDKVLSEVKNTAGASGTEAEERTRETAATSPVSPHALLRGAELVAGRREALSPIAVIIPIFTPTAPLPATVPLSGEKNEQRYQDTARPAPGQALPIPKHTTKSPQLRNYSLNKKQRLLPTAIISATSLKRTALQACFASPAPVAAGDQHYRVRNLSSVSLPAPATYRLAHLLPHSLSKLSSALPQSVCPDLGHFPCNCSLW